MSMEAGNEIDVAVAKVCGAEGDGGYAWAMFDSDRKILHIAIGFADGQSARLFSPSTDLNDAFWAAEKICGSGKCPEWKMSVHCTFPEGHVEIEPYIDAEMALPEYRRISVIADTPALAICRAILAVHNCEPEAQ